MRSTVFTTSFSNGFAAHDVREMSDTSPLRRCRFAMLMFSQGLREACDAGTLPSYMACQMDAEIKSLLASLGSCSRLKHTPIPLAYVIHLRTFLVRQTHSHAACVLLHS